MDFHGALWLFLWKYALFKPLHMFLASALFQNLHATTFASMLMKSSGLLHEATAVLAGNDTSLTENITQDRKRFIFQSKHIF